ncbi:MAG: TPM domain-containing protein [Novosphingobium sp.]
MAKPIHLTAAEHERVSSAVAQAESHSAGEIVTIVTERSDGYADIVLAWAGFVALTALTAFSVFTDFYLDLYDLVLGDWGREWTHQGIATLAATIAIVKFIAMVLLQFWPPLKWFLVPRFIKAGRARARAITCFKVGAERRTHGRTGILIYVSLREPHAELLADAAIASKVSPEVWGEAMAALLAGIRAGDLASGLVGAVEKVGAVLAQHFPRAADDQNELPDRVIEV